MAGPHTIGERIQAMTTEYIAAVTPKAVCRAADLLQRGEVVAFPTETVYGLGAVAFNSVAVRKVFDAKGRPADNPLIVHVAAVEDIHRIAVRLPPLFGVITARFFPGPLTIIVDKHPDVPDIVTAGLPSVAVRMPAHDVALALIRAVGEPLVAPSANRSGRPSPTSAQHVLDDLDTRIAAVLDGGICTIGIESTVISLRGNQIAILRPGSITKEELEEATGQGAVYADMGKSEVPVAPGMKYRHYAPQARIILAHTQQEVQQRLQGARMKVIRVLANEPIEGAEDVRLLCAATLYAEFRQADADGMEEIVLLCSSDIQGDKGLMNRILKAAAG